MSVALPPSPRQSVAAADHGRVSGTPLDVEYREEEQQQLPGRRYAFAMFAGLAAVYFIVGYRVTVGQHVIVFDALDRLTRAYLVWHNAPPKLAAIGFVFPPLTTFVFLPFAVIKPLATSLIALPLTSAIFAALTVVTLDRTLARCDMPPMLRLPLLALFAFNPFWLFYAGNGMSEVVYSFFLASGLYFFVSWYATTEPRYLIGAGFAISIIVLVRYGFLIWGLLMAILIGVALVRRRASAVEVEGSVIAFAAPVIYVMALWILFNALIIGSPFGWVGDATTSQQAVNATGEVGTQSLGLDQITQRLLQLNVAVFPLAFLAVPALVATFVAQRNDMALWLASFIVLGIVIMGVHALTADQEGLLTLRDAMPMYLTTFVGAAWVYRSMPELRLLVLGLTALVLVIGLFTSWAGMKNYPFQSQEQAFTRALFSAESQEGKSSRGGFNVGIAAEARMAEYIKTELPQKRDSILTDNAKTFGVMMLTGRPGIFFDRIDEGDANFRSVVQDPFGKVEYLLISTNRTSDDIIRRRYPRANQGTVGGLQVVFRTERYVLVSVADRQPRAGARAPSGAAGTSGATGAATP